MFKLPYRWWWVLLVAPILSVAHARGQVAGYPEIDLVGHVWTMWNASLGDPSRSTLVAFPYGVDLLPIVGGWLDIAIGGILVRLGVPPLYAWNVVVALWLAVAGLGGLALGHASRMSSQAAVIVGLLLQCDGYLAFHLLGGRTEQAGIGFVALAVAGALTIWRGGSWAWVAATGVAGALVVFTSYELAMILAVSMVFVVVALGAPPEGALKRWGAAMLLTLALTAPFVTIFALRAASVRSADEGVHTLLDARANSVGLLAWLTTDAIGPSVWVLATLVTLPWTTKLGRRALGVLFAGLVVALVLALGPDPGLWAPGDLGLRQGPWGALQTLPFFGWFHVPRRVLVVFSLVAPVAAGRWLDTIRWRRSAALVLLVACVASTARAPWFTLHRWGLPTDAGLSTIRTSPVAGAVLDLPLLPPGNDALPDQLAQMVHQRPIPTHMTSPRLTPANTETWRQVSVLADWLAGGPLPHAADLGQDRARLRDAGVGWVVVHRDRLPPQRQGAVLSQLRETWGPPAFALDNGAEVWVCAEPGEVGW